MKSFSPIFSKATATLTYLLAFLLLFFCCNTHAQDSIIHLTNTEIPQFKYNKNKVKWVAATNVAGYGGAMMGLYASWYKNYPQSSFHTFNDNGEWLHTDKYGHLYSTYAESIASAELWRWTGIERKKRIWISGLSGLAYQTAIEVLDGFSAQWGWSWTDFATNLAGSGLFISQELLFGEQLLQLKWSFHPTSVNDPVLKARSNELYGTGFLERTLKDYNGQTYWFSMHVKTFFPNSKIPKWLQISIGTGAEGLYGARTNQWTDNSGFSYNRTNIKRYKQWYLAPDVDLTKIKTRKKGVRLLLNALNVIKFPAPALELSNGKLKFHAVYF